MRYLLILTAAAVLAGPAVAAGQAADPPGAPPTHEAAPQAPAPSASATAEKPPVGETPAAAPTGGAANTAATAPGLAVGLPVKDNTGATIGLITDLKTDTDGRQVAVVRMGADAFSVETDRLAVQNGAAAINATQAQLKQMIRRR